MTTRDTDASSPPARSIGIAFAGLAIVWFFPLAVAVDRYDLVLWLVPPLDLDFINTSAAEATRQATDSDAVFLSQHHEYLRFYGEQSLNWFFFAATINGAIVAAIFGLRRVETARYLPAFFILCDMSLAVGYAVVLPGVYHGYADLIEQRVASIGGVPGTPEKLWSWLALLVSGVFVLMAFSWWWFFFTVRGRRSIVRATQRDKAGKGDAISSGEVDAAASDG